MQTNTKKLPSITQIMNLIDFYIKISRSLLRFVIDDDKHLSDTHKKDSCDSKITWFITYLTWNSNTVYGRYTENGATTNFQWISFLLFAFFFHDGYKFYVSKVKRYGLLYMEMMSMYQFIVLFRLEIVRENGRKNINRINIKIK